MNFEFTLKSISQLIDNQESGYASSLNGYLGKLGIKTPVDATEPRKTEMLFIDLIITAVKEQNLDDETKSQIIYAAMKLAQDDMVIMSRFGAKADGKLNDILNKVMGTVGNKDLHPQQKADCFRELITLLENIYVDTNVSKGFVKKHLFSGLETPRLKSLLARCYKLESDARIEANNLMKVTIPTTPAQAESTPNTQDNATAVKPNYKPNPAKIEFTKTIADNWNGLKGKLGIAITSKVAQSPGNTFNDLDPTRNAQLGTIIKYQEFLEKDPSFSSEQRMEYLIGMVLIVRGIIAVECKFDAMAEKVQVEGIFEWVTKNSSKTHGFLTEAICANAINDEQVIRFVSNTLDHLEFCCVIPATNKKTTDALSVAPTFEPKNMKIQDFLNTASIIISTCKAREVESAIKKISNETGSNPSGFLNPGKSGSAVSSTAAPAPAAGTMQAN